MFCFQYYLDEIALLIILGSDFRACSHSLEHRGGRHDDHDVSREMNNVTQTVSQSQVATKQYECNMNNISHLLSCQTLLRHYRLKYVFNKVNKISEDMSVLVFYQF